MFANEWQILDPKAWAKCIYIGIINRASLALYGLLVSA